MLNQNVRGPVSGFLQNLPLKQALETLLTAYGFELRQREGVFLVDYGADFSRSSSSGRRLWVEVKDSLVSLEVTQAEVKELLQEMARQLNLDLIFYGEVKGQISAKCSGLTFEKAIVSKPAQITGATLIDPNYIKHHLFID